MNETLRKILYVFTKEYKDEIAYEEFIRRHINSFKLNDGNEDLEEKIKILKLNNFHSNFKVENYITK